MLTWQFSGYVPTSLQIIMDILSKDKIPTILFESESSLLKKSITYQQILGLLAKLFIKTFPPCFLVIQACSFNRDLRVMDEKFPSQTNKVRKNKIIFFLTFFESIICVLTSGSIECLLLCTMSLYCNSVLHD